MENLNTVAFYDAYWGSDACMSYLADKQLDEIAAEIVERIGEPKPQAVLDLGGGISRIARLSKAAGHAPHVVDFSLEAVQIMWAKGIAASVYDIRQWQKALIYHSADVVTCTEVLEHLEDPGYVVKLARTCAPRAFFTVPNDCMGPAECPAHLRVFTMDSLRELLQAWWRDVQIVVRHRWLLAECRR